MAYVIVKKCPNCGQEIEYTRENPHRPFCSRHCKMADLGAWFAEEYALSSPLDIEDIALEDREVEDSELLQ
jgi:endogenous inhibitor of DNA gyrase (YacG/DUF329 family)